MANTFKNYAATGVGTSASTILTGPGSTQTTVIGITVANILTSGPITVDVYATIGGTAVSYTHLTLPTKRIV